MELRAALLATLKRGAKLSIAARGAGRSNDPARQASIDAAFAAVQRDLREASAAWAQAFDRLELAAPVFSSAPSPEFSLPCRTVDRS